MKLSAKFTWSAIAASVVSLASLAIAQTWEDLVNPPPGEWPQLARDVARHAYSPLDQITRDNVGQMQLVWARDLGFRAAARPSHIEGEPVVWDGIMYVSTNTGLLALDARTGDALWEYSRPVEEVMPEGFQPFDAGRTAMTNSAPRGAPVVYDGKVFFNTRYGLVVAVDAKTGEEVWTAQVTNPELSEGFTTNPIIADGKLVLGPNGGDYGGAPGRIISVDTENGEILWTFNTVPLDPGDPAFATWNNPPDWEAGIGGGSAWNAGAYDPVTRTVVYGTGQPIPWDRIDPRRADDGEVTSDLYTASFVGLDVDTGELKWYHQVVPGDEWDYDQLTVPMFADLDVDGEAIRAALLATTTGYVVILDADTGEFIRAHQIHPEPTVHIGYTEDGQPIIDDSKRMNQEGMFNRVCPGLRWAGIAPAALSESTGLLYRPNNINCSNYAAATIPDDWEPGQTAFRSENGPKTDDFWFEGREGGISAINPVTGEVVWEWGTYHPHDAGVVATASDLLFFAARDRKVRAVDATTGEVLWEHAVTSGSQAGTITYAVDGKQYVASLVGISSGSAPQHPDSDEPPSVGGNAAVFVFSLPD